MFKTVGAAILIAAACLAASPLAAAAADAERGKQTYATRCAFCHGQSGAGDGPAGAALRPPPPNLTGADFWSRTTPHSIRTAIEDGKPNSPMVGFKATLSAAELDDLVADVESFKPQAVSPEK